MSNYPGVRTTEAPPLPGRCRHSQALGFSSLRQRSTYDRPESWTLLFSSSPTQAKATGP